MTVATTTSSVSYTGTGSLTAYSVPFKFFQGADLTVKLTPSGGSQRTLVEGVDYTLTGAGVDAGGTLTLTTALATGDVLYIERNQPIIQGVNFRVQGSFSPVTHENAFDKAAMVGQQLDRRATAVEGRATSLETRATSLEGRETAVEGRATVLEGRATTVEGRASALEGRATTLEGRTTAVENRETGVETRTSALEAIVAIPGSNPSLINVRNPVFGAKGDGVTDDTAAFVDAFAAAAGGQTVFVPKGTYMVRMVGTTMPAGVQLVGEGYASVIKVIPFQLSATPNTSYVVFKYGPNTTIRDIRFDCSKDAMDRSVATSVLARCLYPDNTTYSTYASITNVLFENVWVHDLMAVGDSSESFGFMTGMTVDRPRFVNCRAWNIEGTGFHVTGNIDESAGGATWNGVNSQLLDGGTVVNCEAWSCTWMGISLYGTKNCSVLGGRFFSNTKHGVNSEWSDNIAIRGAEAFGNGHAGLGTYSKVHGFVTACYIHDNNTTLDNFGAEITCQAGTWFEGSPVPNGSPGKLILSGNRVEPLPAMGVHLLQQGNKSVTFGASVGDGTYVRQADAWRWVFRQNTSDTSKNYGPFHFEGLFEKPIDIGRPDTMPLDGGVSRASYVTGGQLTAFAQTIANAGGAANQFHGIRSTFVFRPGRTYLVRLRVKVVDVNGTWDVRAEDSPGTNRAPGIQIDPGSMDVGQWNENEFIFTNAGITNQRLIVVYNGTTASSLVVDYLNAFEVTTQHAQVDGEHWAGRIVGHGTAAPASGAFNVGDIWLNDTPAVGVLHNWAWVCTAAGSPGTWKEFGHIGTDTDQPTFGDNTTAGQISLNGPTSTNRQFIFSTNGSSRWIARANSTAETGSNVGSDLEFSARDDTGAVIGAALLIVRSTMEAQLQRIKIGGGTSILKHISNTGSVTPGTIAAGATWQGTVTVTGAAIGDEASCGFAAAMPAGIVIGHPEVSALNTVRVTLYNPTAGALTVASGGGVTVRASVWQH